MFDTNMYKYRELQEFGQFLKVSVRFYGARETVGMRQNQSLQRNVSFSFFLSFSFSFSFFLFFFYGQRSVGAGRITSSVQNARLGPPLNQNLHSRTCDRAS